MISSATVCNISFERVRHYGMRALTTVYSHDLQSLHVRGSEEYRSFLGLTTMTCSLNKLALFVMMIANRSPLMSSLSHWTTPAESAL